MYLSLSLRAWDCVASARRGLPFGRKNYLLTYPYRVSVSLVNRFKYYPRISKDYYKGIVSKPQKGRKEKF